MGLLWVDSAGDQMIYSRHCWHGMVRKTWGVIYGLVGGQCQRLDVVGVCGL